MVDKTPEELQSSLQHDRAWRRIELGISLRHASHADVGDSEAMCRAFWLLQYAHWEGFVKNAVDRYLNFIAIRQLKFSELQHGFRLLPASPLYSAMKQIQNNDPDKLAALSRISLIGDQRFKKKHIEVSTNSNLRFCVLQNLSTVACVDLHSFVSASYLDKILADRRNEIAHGSWLVIDKTEASKLRDTCSSWMDQILNNLVNAASLESYRV